MRIRRAPYDELVAQLEAGYPNESCGVLLGQDGLITEAARAENDRQDSARNRYLIDPRAYDRIEREADRRGLQVLGIYHSHPDVASKPSEFDRTNAWPELSYLIVSVVRGRAASAQSWRLRPAGSQFDEEPVEIIAEPTTIRR